MAVPVLWVSLTLWFCLLGDGGVCRRRSGVLHLHGGGLQSGSRVHRRLHLLVDTSERSERELR